MQRKVLVTGGAGFIGSAVCRHLVAEGASVLNIDALTYAGNLQSLAMIGNAPNYRFAKIDICDRRAVAEAFATFSSRPSDPSRRRESRRPLDHGQRRLHPDKHRGRLLDA
jgi:nucleoside-diphosphate-sugar epimerase